MSQKRKRGSRGGKRVKRGLAAAERHEELLEEEHFVERYERLYAKAHKQYAALLMDRTGLSPLPRERNEWGHFVVPLPNDWALEITSEGDGPLVPPEEEEGQGCIFWLVTPDGLYAAEDDRVFEGDPELIPEAIITYAAHLLWSHFEEIVGPKAAGERSKGLPRVSHRKIKRLVERGDFKQPEWA